MPTITEIYNLALAMIGDHEADTGSVQAAACAKHYPYARDEVLAEYPWNATSQRRQLARVPGYACGAYYWGARDQYIVVGADGVILTRYGTGAWQALHSGVAGDLTAVTLHGTTLVAVGAKGVILVSTDYGVTWTAATSGTAKKIHGVYSDGTTCVAVGSGGLILTSTDLAAWTARTSGVATPLLGVMKGGSTWAAVGARGVILTSTDLAAWTARTSGVTVTLNAVAYGASAWVVAGASGTVLSSPDAATWTARTSGLTGELFTVRYGAAFVAGGAGGITSASTDGATWTAGTVGATPDLRAVAYSTDALEYLVMGEGRAYASADGATWIEQKDEPESGYLYRYVLPGPCLRPAMVSDDDMDDYSDTIPWAMEGDFLVCDCEEVFTRYCARELDPARYPSHVAGAVAANLGVRLADNLVHSESLTRLMVEKYRLALDKAMDIDSQGQNNEQPRGSYGFVTARYR